MANVAQKRPFASLLKEGSIESTPPPSPPLQSNHDLMTLTRKKWCIQTIKSLKKHKRAIAFLDPVDPILFNIPDYFDIIKNPMDLGTVEKKLIVDKYNTMQEFKDDVQLVFDNCYLYNNPGDPVCLDAKKLEEQFHKLCKKEPAPNLDQNKSNNFSPSTVDTTYNLNSQTPKSISPVTATPNTITIPAKSKQVSSTIKVKFNTSSNHNNNNVSSFVTNEKSNPLSESIVNSSSKLKNYSDDVMDKMPDDQFKRCEAIVKELKKPKYQGLNWPFLKPVDADAWGATDYYEIIKNPMDMTTYERKLYEDQYTSEDRLIDDIRLMFDNCYIYNPPEHLVHNLGKEFQQVFEKQWAKLLARSQGKKSSSISNVTGHTAKHVSKKRRTSVTDDILPLTKEHLSPIQKETAENMDISPSTSIHIDTYESIKVDTPKDSENVESSASNSGRSTILRLKLSVKPKEEEPPKSKPITKVPGLELSKEPPFSNTPKLAISEKSSTPLVKETRLEKNTPAVLHNHDKWLALAKSSSSQPRPQTKQQQQQPQVKNTKDSPNSNVMVQKPKEPAVPAIAAFDINDLYNKIHNEKKLKEQKKREEQERWEKSERIRLEKEKLASEERQKQMREFNQHLQAQRQKDIKDRQQKLNDNSIDISMQKMKFIKFESGFLSRDQDWREIYTWQRDTIDYRHIPVPSFVKRAPIHLSDLRKRLLSKCVRLENSKIRHQLKIVEDDEGSDMDIE